MFTNLKWLNSKISPEPYLKYICKLLWAELCTWITLLCQKARESSKNDGNMSKEYRRASLVAQWLRIRLPMQGTRVRALVPEDPTCPGAAGPVSHNYWACASGACAPQQERSRYWQAGALRWRVAPTCHNWRKPSHRNEDPSTAINKLIN